MTLFPIAAAAAVMTVGMMLSGCKKDCRENVRLGDFEYSQNNYKRAEALYRDAWATDSVSCADVAVRMENLRRFLP